MNVKVFKVLMAMLVMLATSVTSSAKVSVDDVDKCKTVKIYGSKASDVIEITALSGDSRATKGVAFLKFPGKKDYTAKGFKYLTDGMEEGCFGVVEDLTVNGKRYSTAAIAVSFSASSTGVTVEYSIFSGDNTLLDGSFRLNKVVYEDSDRKSYIDDEWSMAYANFGLWMMCHVEEYKD